MQKPKFKPKTKERMQALLGKAKTANEVKRIQCILFGACGANSQDIGPMVGFHPQYVRVIWKRYKDEGERAILGERRGKGRGRAFLTEDEEEAFLKPFFDQAKKGGILMVKPLKQAYEKKAGREVHFTAMYKILARHDWRKIVPRPVHPKADKEVQEKFKAFFPI